MPPRFPTGVAAAAGAASTRNLGDKLANALGFGSFDERTINPELGAMYDDYLAQLQKFGQGGAEINAKQILGQAGDLVNRDRAEQAYGRQAGSVDLAQQAALGNVPSQAAIQGRQQLDQSMQQNIGLARSGGGASGMRAALYANAKSGQGAAGDAAALRAQEMAAARGQYLQGTQGLSNAAAGLTNQGFERAKMDIGAQDSNRENRTRREEGALTGTGTTLGNLTSTYSHDLDREAGHEAAQAPMGAATIGGIMKPAGAIIDKISDPRAKMNMMPAGDALSTQLGSRQDAGLILQGAASQLGTGNPLGQTSSGASAGYASPFQSSIDALNNAPQRPMGNVLGVSYSDPRAKMNAQPANFPERITSAIDAKSGLVPAGSMAPWGPLKEQSLGGPKSIKQNISPAQGPLTIEPMAPLEVVPYTLGSDDRSMGARGKYNPTSSVYYQPPTDKAMMPGGFLGGQAAWDKMGGAGQRDFLQGMNARQNAGTMGDKEFAAFLNKDVEDAKLRTASKEDQAAQDKLAKKAADKYGKKETDDTEDFMTKLGEDGEADKLPAGLQGPRYTGQMAAEDFVAPTLTQATDTPPGQNPEAGKPLDPNAPKKKTLGQAIAEGGEKMANPAGTFAVTYSPLNLQGYQLGPKSDPRSKESVSDAGSPIRDFEEKSKGFTYQYKSPEFEDGTAPPGTTHLGPMADDLKAVKGGIGETLTYTDPQTGLLGVNTGRLTLANSAAVNDLHERIKQLEAKRKGKK